MTKKRKNPNAVGLGKLGGAARAKDPESLAIAQAKGRRAQAERFKTEKERSAYYSAIGKLGHKAKKAKKLALKKLKKVIHK